ncbi:hypothetical protein [Halostreptopolyspora alba]|uniref:hypothetical protein n=1 Tax=Halostreptopolyspora alba TaxID=2487137 RepID=UPI0026D7CD3F
MHGGNPQGLMDPAGFPLFISDAQPGSVHDLTAARLHLPPALYAATARGLPTLADLGYDGADIGVITRSNAPGAAEPRRPMRGRSTGRNAGCAAWASAGSRC